MARVEASVSPNTPRPPGYGFLKKGNPFMTALCRRRTLAAGETLYVVSQRGATLGLLAPEAILSDVKAEELKTRDKRGAAVEKRDIAARDAFEQALMRLYPETPPGDVATLVTRTLKKGSKRVGRTSKLAMETKVRLAVAAHVRHCHTNYDTVVRGCSTKWAARQSIREKASQVIASWAGAPLPPSSGGPKAKCSKRQSPVQADESNALKRGQHPPAVQSPVKRDTQQALVDKHDSATVRKERKRRDRHARRARKREATRLQVSLMAHSPAQVSSIGPVQNDGEAESVAEPHVARPRRATRLQKAGRAPTAARSTKATRHQSATRPKKGLSNLAGHGSSRPLTRGRLAALQRDEPDTVLHDFMEIVDSSDESGEETAESDDLEEVKPARRGVDVEVIIIDDSGDE